jgi:hypothetical protein
VEINTLQNVRQTDALRKALQEISYNVVSFKIQEITSVMRWFRL